MSAEKPAPATAPVPKKSSKKLVVFALVGLLFAAGAAGGGWYYMQQQKTADVAPAQGALKKSTKKPLFAPLEPFTVNLQDARGERYAQIGVTLQLEDPAVESELKERLPAVRNEILLLIASKKLDELLSAEGKQQLAQQIGVRAAHAIGVGPGVENPVKNVLFSQFIVQ